LVKFVICNPDKEVQLCIMSGEMLEAVMSNEWNK
jgi:hypothetical protein